MAKRRKKPDSQIGLFDQEMFKPVDLHKELPVQVQVEQPKGEVGEKHEYGPKVALGVTACPICGERIRNDPDGVRRCTKCQWFQGLAE